jgi:RimJ/RimL family protein N-acetyltransferase
MALALPIETERLVLREFREADLEAIHEYAQDPEVARYMPWGPNTREATLDFLSRKIREQSEERREQHELAIELKSEDRVIGGVRLGIKDEANRTADIGYVLNRRYWGRGMAPEAVRALIDHAFRHLKLHRVWASCDVRNSASYRVMEKLGMRREATFLNDIRQKGEWRSTHVYAILAEEWLAAKGVDLASDERQ